MPLGFAGTYNDKETGLYFAQQRYYDPVTARFTTKDAYRGDAGSPISQNRYIYCHQNPISYADPSGFAPMEGTSAVDSTPTEQKTEHKTDVKPPENMPDAVRDDSWVGTGGKDFSKHIAVWNPGGCVNTGVNEWQANIGNHQIRIYVDDDGNLKAESLDDSPEGEAIADGLNDAFAQMPKEYVENLKNNFYMLQSFISEVQDFYNRNYENFKRMYGTSFGMLRRFIYCSPLTPGLG
jgi:RHS repeat-associated protein